MEITKGQSPHRIINAMIFLEALIVHCIFTLVSLVMPLFIATMSVLCSMLEKGLFHRADRVEKRKDREKKKKKKEIEEKEKKKEEEKEKESATEVSMFESNHEKTCLRGF